MEFHGRAAYPFPWRAPSPRTGETVHLPGVVSWLIRAEKLRREQPRSQGATVLAAHLDKSPVGAQIVSHGGKCMLDESARLKGRATPRLDPVAKAKTKPKSLRLAVTAKCWDCVGGDADPGPRQRIRECGVRRCPLHPVRPYQT